MTYEELKKKARSLPLSPGVYIMRDSADKVIYVGKAKKLKNRVSQYFQDTVTHSPKTKIMVSKIHHFDVIVAASEFEALVLECSLIKRYAPRYNILLKDDKGYPYLRLNMKDPYPRITMVSKLCDDSAAYFGPFGSRGVTQDVLQVIQKTLQLPDCGRKFPEDIGKGRPCLNYHMNTCAGWCGGGLSEEEYRSRIEQARQLLQGNYKRVAENIRSAMLDASESLNFELAASLRDRLNSVENLGKKQFVTAGIQADVDAIGYAQTETRGCFAVLHFSSGNLLDKEYEILPAAEDSAEVVSSLVKQFYLSRGHAPKRILLPFEMDDGQLFAQMLSQQLGRSVKIHVPERGDSKRLVELANINAEEEAQRVTGREERLNGALLQLGKMLSVPTPARMESFDISNISGTDIVAGMVVFCDGRPRKSDYKRFKLEGLAGQDDYASMHQVLMRRFTHYKAGDKGFDVLPDLLLIDGGIAHANVALEVLTELGLSIPIYGMVKDDRHRTRALMTPSGEEIGIDGNQAVFSLIGNIQEETHRFAISYHRKLRSKRLRYSELDGIPGIGPKRKQELLKRFQSLTAIGQASLDELERLLPKDAAAAVYNHFHKGEEE